MVLIQKKNLFNVGILNAHLFEQCDILISINSRGNNIAQLVTIIIIFLIKDP